MISNQSIATAFLTETVHRLDRSFKRIEHCLDQLEEPDIWWRPNEKMNSAGNLILHISGNLRQWILHGLGGQEDIRNRPEEFEVRQRMTKQELRQLLSDLKPQIEQTLNNFNPENLMQEKRIQGLEVRLINAVYSTMTHLEGHVGQIVYITRVRKGDDYKLFWKPETAEQESKRNNQ